MKTLYLCRHAKSSWADAGMDDFDRPLNERGQRNAPIMAKMFKERGEPVDLIVTSPANRAITTARSFATALGLSGDRFREERAIYLAERGTLAHLVNGLPGHADRVMLFGHNPGFTDVVNYLSDAGISNLPTCGIVRIDFAVNEWQHIIKGSGTLVWFDYPKRHPGQD
ncbi:MAG: histidine phosphatase family protein [Flavobacteriales bacterium]|nr:histidine phosphatase family protein [Flavobacteriales bacterium]